MRRRVREGAAILLALLILCLGAAQAEPKARRIDLDQVKVTLYTGDTLQLSVRAVLPAAAQQGYTWGTSNAAVATVDENGRVTPHKAGVARIYAQTTGPGKVRGVCKVTVKRENIRRALVVGSGAANRRLGAGALPSVAPEVNGVNRALTQNQFEDGYGINTSVKLNVTKAQLAAAITRKFKDAGERDISYVYLTGHGLRSGGEYYLLPCRDKMVSAQELRRMLDKIPGKVVLVVNACYSGTVISGKAAGDSFSQGFVQSFLAGGQGKYTAITGDKYLVLCATAAREEGWIYLDEASFQYLDAFGTPFAAGVGWDYVGGERSLLADTNGDFKVTHRELYQYLRTETARRAAQLGYTQTVTAYPSGGSDQVLFELG